MADKLKSIEAYKNQLLYLIAFYDEESTQQKLPEKYLLRAEANRCIEFLELNK